MNLRKLAIQGVVYHWRTHLGVVLGVMLGSAILSGALVVGDSVRYTLQSIAFSRIGETDLALPTGDRLFPTDLADRLTRKTGTKTVPALVLRGAVRRADGERFANRVQVLGITPDFWDLATTRYDLNEGDREGILLNERSAVELQAEIGDEVFLRVENPSLLQREAPLSTDEDASVARRYVVRGILGDDQLGRFDLQANQIAPFNTFLPLDSLQDLIGRPGKANLLLIPHQTESGLTESAANLALEEVFDAKDADLEMRMIDDGSGWELSTERVFLEATVVKAALRLGDSPTGVLTYFVNRFRFGDKACPYSMVSAVGVLGATQEGWTPAPLLAALPRDLKDDEAVINEWLANDLGLAVGDVFEMDYYVIGPLRTVEEKTASFRVRAIVPIAGPFDDPDLMPGFPGLADAEDCRQWEPGVPIDLDAIRDEDEVYWDDHRGTPKAFITLAAGQKMWRNRYGDLTAIRAPLSGSSLEAVVDKLNQGLEPSALGFRFAPVRDRALAASTQAMDFGGLFIGFSFFLIVAALLFMGLMNVFGIEQRNEEVGTLLALGFLPSQVRRVLLMEGFLLSILGSLLGVGIGVGYAKLVLWGLSTIWSGATAGLQIAYWAEPMTLFTSFFAGVVISAATLWLTVRRQARTPARQLLSAGREASLSAPRSRRSRTLIGFGLGLALLVGGGAAVFQAAGDPSHASGLFFAAGGMFLLAGLALAYCYFSRSAVGGTLSLATVGSRNAARRIGRSLTTVALLAAGSFLVIAVGANRHGPPEDMQVASSGTGGFSLFGETTLPVLHDLNTERGAEAYALTLDDLEGAEVVPMRFLEGDDASCLNLNRPQMPQVLGVDPEVFSKRGSFTFAKMLDPIFEEDPWRMLEAEWEDGSIPAVADQNTVLWILGKSLGDSLAYVNGKGERVTVRIVGLLSSSVLQGNVVISERNFIEKFPDVAGYRAFLVSAEPGTMEAVARNLSFGLEDQGVRIVTTAERLANFNVVENTYLSIFQSLGGLGMILGSLGLGVVVLRNVLERRGELALLRAVGFEQSQVKRIVLIEHWQLAVMGLAIGTVAGLVSVLPALQSAQHPFPYLSLSLTLAGMLFSCLLWTYLAALFALRGPLLTALRNE